MNGIGGIFNCDGAPVRPEDLEVLRRGLVHRGSGKASTWRESSIGFVRCGVEPITREDGLTITADARIDNREELLGLLSLPRSRADDFGDASLILAAYSRWGELCVDRLLGDFAFAIWDSRAQKLFCARDHFGVKPFCYHHQAQLFVFASEVRALVGLENVPCRINESRIGDYLLEYTEGFDTTSTFYQDVLRLPPAHVAVVTSTGMDIRRYWELDSNSKTGFGSDGEYVEAFLEAFGESVKSRMRGTESAACMLSGGLDSAAVAGIARDQLAQGGCGPLHVFSAVSKTSRDCPETTAIEAIVSGGGIQSHQLNTSQVNEFAPRLSGLVGDTDDLFDHYIDLPHVLFGAARQAGFTVMLDGVDGDLVASQGADCVGGLVRSHKWAAAFDEAAGNVRVWRYNSAFRQIFSACFGLFSPQIVESWRAIRHRRKFAGTIKTTIIDEDFARRIDLAGRLKQHGESKRIMANKDFRARHAANLSHPNLAVALERYDRVAARCGVESRHPFLDKRLVELCLGWPWNKKNEHGWTKITVRRALTGIVPAEVCWRRDGTHLGWKITAALIEHQRQELGAFVADRLDLVRPYVDLAALRRAWNTYLANDDPEAAFLVWEAYTLAGFVDRIQFSGQN
jgi:asparagine synthase (glutamine-hydrolysing)